ncbi:MAG: hypothetical protein F4104_02680, partial [Gemmatimonadetes bacterium]|nr:hypothetical protein [Gemmatimonadota bacterium]
MGGFELDLLREFHGPNAGYVIALYEQYLEDPESVDAETRALFSRHAADLDGDPTAGTDGTSSAASPARADGTASADGSASPAGIDQIVFIA